VMIIQTEGPLDCRWDCNWGKSGR